MFLKLYNMFVYDVSIHIHKYWKVKVEGEENLENK